LGGVFPLEVGAGPLEKNAPEGGRGPLKKGRTQRKKVVEHGKGRNQKFVKKAPGKRKGRAPEGKSVRCQRGTPQLKGSARPEGEARKKGGKVPTRKF